MMDEQTSQVTELEAESLRYQLAELNNRSRWYSSELWQIPFAYLAVTGVVIVQVAEKGEAYLGIGFAASAAFGVFVLIHVFRIRRSEQRAIGHLRQTEIALHLPVTAQTALGRPKIFQIALIVAVIGYTIAAALFLFR